MYKLTDPQQMVDDKYFKTEKEIHKWLISYHGIDWTDEERDIEEVSFVELVEHGQWEIVELKEYYVEYVEIIKYHTTFINAENEDEAREKFTEMLNNGDVDIRGTEIQTFEIGEV